MSPEWARYFQSATGQINSNTSSVVNITTNVSNIAGGSSGLMQDSEGDVEFIPGPQGAPGAQGPAGPAIFLLQDPECTETFWPTKNT
jgi:hypothetical protein